MYLYQYQVIYHEKKILEAPGLLELEGQNDQVARAHQKVVVDSTNKHCHERRAQVDGVHELHNCEGYILDSICTIQAGDPRAETLSIISKYMREFFFSASVHTVPSIQEILTSSTALLNTCSMHWLSTRPHWTAAVTVVYVNPAKPHEDILSPSH